MGNASLQHDSTATLIQDARVLDPASGRDQRGDVLIEHGTITAIEPPGQISSSRAKATVKAQGSWILPGFIDVHVHLREPGQEYKETIETGTLAAVAGGFTSVACMANTDPVNDSPYITAYIRERAKASASCRVFPIGAVSKGLRGEELAEIGGMVREGAVAISDDGMPVMNSYLMRKAMNYATTFDIPVVSHAEDLNLCGQGVMNESALSSELGLRGIPSAAEEIMVAREIALCRLTRARTHIAHLSTALGVALVRRAKSEGLPVTAEVTPHHLTLTEDAVRTYDTCCKMRPPLRTQADVDALIGALADGTIDMIATDHAPHGAIDKNVEFDQAANGIIGLQTAVALTFDLVRKGKISLQRWVESLTSAPAKLLKVPHGTLAIGKAADLILFNPESMWTYETSGNASRSENSPYLNRSLTGRSEMTWVGGRLAYDATTRMSRS